jgi:ribosomal protein L40E
MKCLRCGLENPPDAKRCTCGFDLQRWQKILRTKTTLAVIICAVVFGILIPILWPHSASLSLDQLNLSAHTLYGHWRGARLIFDDELSWSGSAGVMRKTNDGRLWLFTNSHCLGLNELAESRWFISIKVADYKLMVKFASGKERQVLRFADQVGDLDLALVEVNGEGLVEGVDYVVIPYKSGLQVRQGNDVVAIGSPFGVLTQTETFGKVSALRDKGMNGERCHTIQIDAAVNHGNSGGPLFKKDGTKYFWIGVNTWGLGDLQAQGLNFAISASEVAESEYHWWSADNAGAAAALREERDRAAVAK